MEPTLIYSDGEKTTIYDNNKQQELKAQIDVLYAIVKPMAETLQTRSIIINPLDHIYNIKQFWSNPISTTKISISCPGLPYIDTIINYTDSDIFLTLNDVEIIIKANQSEKLDLAIGGLAFVSKNIVFTLKCELIDYDSIFNLLTTCLNQLSISSINSNYWEECIDEFIGTMGCGICSDAPEIKENFVSDSIPPFIREKLNIISDNYTIYTDLNKVNFFIRDNKNFITKIKNDCVTPITYNLSDEQISNRIKINSNKFTYTELCEKWKIFYNDKKIYIVNQFIEMNMHNHHINKSNQVLFPVYLTGENICDVIGDFRKCAFNSEPMLWRNYILADGCIGINNKY